MLYHFRLIEEVRGDADDEGTSLPDLAAARAYAITQARGIIASDVLDGTLPLDSAIEITSEDGTVLMTMPFTDAIKFRIPSAAS